MPREIPTKNPGPEGIFHVLPCLLQEWGLPALWCLSWCVYTTMLSSPGPRSSCSSHLGVTSLGETVETNGTQINVGKEDCQTRVNFAVTRLWLT